MHTATISEVGAPAGATPLPRAVRKAACASRTLTALRSRCYPCPTQMLPEPQDAAGERPAPDKSQAMSALLLELATMPSRSEDWEHVLRPGETVGRFQLVSEIGRGGFGIVYEARDRELGRSVAFKAVRPGRGLEAGAAELLLREAEAIARLSHPNLVTLHDVGRCEQGPYLVLELLRGVTLGDRLQAGPLPVREALRIAVEVTRGLAHAHGAGVTHRDLKPSNVFLCDGGHVKVLDFGMAHAFGRQRILGGTPAYMAPEQWEDGHEDERTDLFALGVMLFQMIKGDVPLPEGGKSLEAGPAPRLEVAECPAVGELVARLLERNPRDRPHDAGEVLAVLGAFRDALRTAEDTTTRFVLPAPQRRRPRVLAWLTAVALAAAASLLVWMLVSRTLRVGDAPAVAVLPFTALSTGPDDASIAAGLQAEVVTQLTQIAGLRVIGRSEVHGYDRFGQRDLRALARQLGVGEVVEGSIQRDGDRVRIQVHLLDPRTGEEHWAQRFDRRVDDLFAVQSEVALDIVEALGARLTVAERERAERPPTRDPGAHQAYLRALYFWGRSSDDLDRVRAQELLSAAVARDPEFALAHAWLAVLDTELANSAVPGFPFELTCERAREEATRALELDRGLPQAHGAVAEVRWACDADSAGALKEYEIQVRGAPGDGVARVNLGFTRMALGQWEAAAADLRAALVLDPQSYFVAMLVADRMIQLRQFDEAERACRRAQEISPGDLRAPSTCAMIAYWRSGDVAPARAALDGMAQQWGASNMAAASAVELLYLLPERTLSLAAAGRLPDPISDQDPFIPRAFMTGVAHQMLGDAERARADLTAAIAPLEATVTALRQRQDRGALAIQLLWLARAHAGLGRGEQAAREAQEALELIQDQALRATAFVDAGQIAAAAGRNDEAVRMLAQALRSPGGTATPASLRNDPALAALCGDPGFERLVGGSVAGR